MDINEICKVGQWLKFKAGTCFGEDKDHLGLFVAISDDLAVCIAVNATSRVDNVKDFANKRRINSEETIIVIKPDAPEASFHFGHETAFDCNRPSIVKNEELADWVANQKIEPVDYNIKVNEELLKRIKEGILKSPLVSKKHKNLIKPN
ncbi:hypothetical protein IJH27_01630 [Candidatus Saccharibacteria bacterium]|nr:hypothetical protein [Candidatus Saccharibacteria bacterium]